MSWFWYEGMKMFHSFVLELTSQNWGQAAKLSWVVILFIDNTEKLQLVIGNTIG